MSHVFLKRALRRVFGRSDRAKLRALLVTLMANYTGPRLDPEDYKLFRSVLDALEDD